MAVIGWDAAADKVTIWNPWGNTIEPKGTGPNAGYKTVNGVFTMPLDRFHPILCRYRRGEQQALQAEKIKGTCLVTAAKSPLHLLSTISSTRLTIVPQPLEWNPRHVRVTPGSHGCPPPQTIEAPHPDD